MIYDLDYLKKNEMCLLKLTLQQAGAFTKLFSWETTAIGDPLLFHYITENDRTFLQYMELGGSRQQQKYLDKKYTLVDFLDIRFNAENLKEYPHFKVYASVGAVSRWFPAGHFSEEDLNDVYFWGWNEEDKQMDGWIHLEENCYALSVNQMILPKVPNFLVRIIDGELNIHQL